MIASMMIAGDSAWPMPSTPASVLTRTTVKLYLPGSDKALVSTPVIFAGAAAKPAAQASPPANPRRQPRLEYRDEPSPPKLVSQFIAAMVYQSAVRVKANWNFSFAKRIDPPRAGAVFLSWEISKSLS